MRKCKYKKIYSKGKKHPTHFQRRSFKEQCRKYNKYKKNKTKHINLSKSKNPYRNNPHNTNIDGIINFPKCINKLDQIIKDIKSRMGKYSISINHKNLDEIDNTSILILTASISDINSNIKTFIKNKKLKPKAEIDERLSAIGYWDALCINHKTKNDNLDYLQIASHDGSTTDNAFHIKIVNFVLEKTGLSEEYKDIFMDAVYEAMANTKEHAYNSKNKKIWLVGAYNGKETEIIFYDIGMGIFNSFQYSQSWFAKFLKKCVKIIGRDKTLLALCTTDLSKYKKRDNSLRGLGMMVYKKLIDEISKERNATLEIYTDNLCYSTSKGNSKLSGKIKGTLIRWNIGEKDER